MNIKSTIPVIAALLFPTAGVSQPTTISEFLELSKADFLQEMEAIHEASWVDLALMFTRLDPAFADIIPPYDDWDDQTKELAECVYDRMAAEDTLDKLAEYSLLQIEFSQFVVEQPELNFINLSEYELVQSRFGVPLPEYLQASSSCGLLDYQGQQMQDTGLMDALISQMQ